MSEDASLRRMVYLFIKEVAETCNPDDIIIVTSSLTKDMTCDVDLYRANALRVLSRIIDTGMLGAIERYVKSAIVDSSAQVASAALVSSLHLLRSGGAPNLSIIKRWISEITTASSSASSVKNPMVQFHSYVLLYQLKKSDKLGVRKLVQTAANSSSPAGTSRGSSMSPLTKVLLIRYTLSLMSTLSSTDDEWRSVHYPYLESLLRDKSEMVVFEAARGLCSLPNILSEDLLPAIHALQLFLSSPKPAIRFASIKCLAKLANDHPRSVSKCNEDLEALISDSNRNISTYAISTLLKTGSEQSMERYLRQISGLLSEIGDEFKIQIVDSIQNLCVVYPQKYGTLLAFLANFLRDEGGFEFKASIIRSMEFLMSTIPACIETALLHLCEFIEDCEFVQLSTQVLALLAKLGPTTSFPNKYIRFIYNRVILEHAAIRAAAVSALIEFGTEMQLRRSVMVLLKACVCDEDDEVRDRALLGIHALSGKAEESKEDTEDEAKYLYSTPMPMTFDQLERSLQKFMAIVHIEGESKEDDSDLLTFDSLPIVEVHGALRTGTIADNSNINTASMDATSPIDISATDTTVDPASIVYAVPELVPYGPIFRSTPSVDLTERETEYYVNCVKHILSSTQHVILQFNILNTLEDQMLRNVRVELTGNIEKYVPIAEIPASTIKYGDTGVVFVVLESQLSTDGDNYSYPTEAFDCELKFGVQIVDPEDDINDEDIDDMDMFDEDYPLENFAIGPDDFMAKTTVIDFRKSWEALGGSSENNGNEVLEKFALKSCKTVADAIRTVIAQLGMQPCDGTDVVSNADSKKPHMLHLSGSFVGNVQVMARAQLVVLDKNTVLKIAVRSADANVSRLVANSIH